MKPHVFGLGELLWDLLPSGRQMGGAPANFAIHAQSLGADAALLSRVGADPAGEDLSENLRRMGLPDAWLDIDPDHPTGTVSVQIAADGQPNYQIAAGVAWDHLRPWPTWQDGVRTADALCFGSLAQRHESSRKTIRDLVSRVPREALRVFDVNLRQHYYDSEVLEHSANLANVLKLNEEELPIVAQVLGIAGTGPALLDAFVTRFQLRLIACTRGAAGSTLTTPAQSHTLPAPPTQVVDTVGAGDSFTAALVMGLLAGWNLETIHQRASAIAAFVCSQPGATPALPLSLRAPFQG